MTQSAARIEVRPDLVHRRVWMGKHPVWVVKDPVSESFYYYGDREHEILTLVDGQTIAESHDQCRERFGDTVTRDQLSRFLADAATKRLAVVPGHSASASTHPSRRWWHQPLAIRLPGITPHRILDWLQPFLTPMTSPLGVCVSIVMMMVAAALVITRFDLLVDDVADAANRMTSPNGVLVVLIAIALAKIVHELAHATACRRLGGECREMGVMLLVGVPCLYCDASDAWLLDRRWKRIAVSAAGIWAELTLASIATFLWIWTLDGSVRDVCVTLMVVCSVSTVLFNGNPLLRYDGYYMLSDWLGIPNLAIQSKSILRGALRRWLWGTPMPSLQSAVAGIGSGGRWLLAGYGILSGAYRIAILTLISWWLYRAADRIGLAAPIGTLLLLAITFFVLRRAASVLTPPPVAQRNHSRLQTTSRYAVVSLVLFGFVIIPFPRHLVAPMSIQPLDGQRVFVVTGGRMMDQAVEGALVKQGDPIAVLVNPEEERELVRRITRYESLQDQLDSLRVQRNTDASVAQRIPTVTEALEDAKQQLQIQRERMNALTIRASRDGQLFAPEATVSRSQDELTARLTIATPLDSINQDAWVEQGTVLGTIGDPRRREAVLTVPQHQIELLRPGQTVTLLMASAPRGAIAGVITDVALSPLHADPEKSNGTGADYQVRVLLDKSAFALPVRLEGNARVTIDNASLVQRLARFLAGTLAFNLSFIET